MNNGNKRDDKKIYLYFLIGITVVVMFIFLHATTLMAEQGAKADFFTAMSGAMDHILKNPFNIKITPLFFKYIGLLALVVGGIAIFMYNDSVRHRHFKLGAESGTAKWYSDMAGYNKKYTEPFGSPSNNGENNMILTKDVYLSMDSRKTLRNNNVLVVGGSGAGKTRFMVKPNILQANCNYIITDPAGELLSTTGQFLVDQGYEVRVFNLVEMAKSNQYNPFHYIRDDLGVLMMINCLIKNTNPDGKSGGDPFWEKSEQALLQALCFYLIKYCPVHQRNFTSVMKLLRAAEVDENDASRKSKLDRIFDEVAMKDPTSIALKQYLTFKMGAGKTLKSILISCSVRLTVFNMQQVENLTRIDNIDLGSMGEGKKALYVIIPAADSTYNFLVSMMYSQLFETLYFIAETKCEGQRLPRPVRFLLDEFANIGQIPEFTKKLATMRKYGISCTVILQNLAQIKTMYKDDWESIVGNCDSFLFLGGQEYSTLEYVSKELGKTTITVRNRNMSNGKNKSSSLSFNQTARDLMTPNEIMTMPKDECICIINGLDPFYGKKYDYTAHPNYRLTGDGNSAKLYKNTLDNSLNYTKEKVEEEAAKRRAAEERKKDYYSRVKTALDTPPTAMARPFSRFSSSELKVPKDIGEIKPPRKDRGIVVETDTEQMPENIRTEERPAVRPYEPRTEVPPAPEPKREVKPSINIAPPKVKPAAEKPDEEAKTDEGSEKKIANIGIPMPEANKKLPADAEGDTETETETTDDEVFDFTSFA